MTIPSLPIIPYTFVGFVLGAFTNFLISGLVNTNNNVDVITNITDWINILSVNKLVINAAIAPILNQNTKNPIVKDSIIIHIPESINQYFHII